MFGRKSTFVALASGMTFTCVALPSAPNWKVFTALLTLNGFFTGGAISVRYVLTVEILPARWRFALYIGTWPLAIVWSGVLGYVCRQWSHFVYANSAFSVLLVQVTMFVVSERPK